MLQSSLWDWGKDYTQTLVFLFIFPMKMVKILSRTLKGLIQIRILGLPQSIDVNQRPVKKFRQGFIGAPAAAGGSENK